MTLRQLIANKHADLVKIENRISEMNKKYPAGWPSLDDELSPEKEFVWNRDIFRLVHPA